MLPPGVSLDQSVLEQMKANSKEYRFDAIHSVKDDDGTIKHYPLGFALQFNGTKTMISYVPIIYTALLKGRTIVINELDNSLHTSLSKFIVNMFLDKNINKKGAQLIFNSHDTYLFNSGLFRRDQIYFVEKQASGNTVLNLLSNYKARKNYNFQKRLSGRKVRWSAIHRG